MSRRLRQTRMMTDPIGCGLRLTGRLALTASLSVVPLFSLVDAAQSRAQSPTENTTAKLPTYEVAAIKPSKAGMGSTVLFTADGLTARNVTLKFLIKMAYAVEDDRILGAPGWLNSETFDIDAKVDSSEVSELSKLSEHERQLMLQQLLADRFRLTLHHEMKDLPVYALVIAKNGPKLHAAKAGDTYPNGIKGPDGKPAGHAGMMMWGGDRLIGQGIPIASMVPPLSQQLGRTVQDRTGLTGTYDIELHWTPDVAAGPSPPRDRAAGDGGLAAESQEPSFFTALQEQLGLKLESRKAPVEVLVIDHVETPSAN
jgi:uncharacterized protein (TIGR03435 family)